MTWILIARRNFIRHLKHAKFSISIIVVGVIAALLSLGYIKSTFLMVKEGTIRGGVGHLQIAYPGEFNGYEETPLEHGISNARWQVLEQKLGEHDNVVQLLPRLKFQGMISKSERSLVFLGQGVAPKKERRLAKNFINTVKGVGLEYGASEDIYRIVIGVELARLLGVEPGDDVTLMAVTVHGGINLLDVVVSGISDSGNPDIDKLQLYAPIELAQELLLTDKISKIVVQLDDTNRTASVQQILQQQLKDEAVRDWYSLSPFYGQLVNLYYRQFSVFGIILAMVIILTMSNTMLMKLYERKREIATLSSIGLPMLGIKTSFVVEAIFLSVFASLIGVSISYVVIELLNLLQLEMPAPPGRSEGYTLFLLYDVSYALYVSGATMLLTALSAWAACIKIGKLNLIEVINA